MDWSFTQSSTNTRSISTLECLSQAKTQSCAEMTSGSACNELHMTVYGKHVSSCPVTCNVLAFGIQCSCQQAPIPLITFLKYPVAYLGSG